METKRTYSVKGVLTAVGKSLLYLLFFLAVQLLAGIVYAAFNAMNDPLGLFGGAAESWYALAVMAAVSAAGCVLCRRGLAGLAAAPASGEECPPAA